MNVNFVYTDLSNFAPAMYMACACSATLHDILSGTLNVITVNILFKNSVTIM